jgi:hypothetical protein
VTVDLRKQAEEAMKHWLDNEGGWTVKNPGEGYKDGFIAGRNGVVELSLLRNHPPCLNDDGEQTCGCDQLAAYDDQREFAEVYLTHLLEVSQVVPPEAAS